MKHLLVTVAVALLSSCAMPMFEQNGELPALNEVAQSRRFSAFEDAMERSPGDQSVAWRVSDVTFGTITPLDTVYSKSDGWCRSYEEFIAQGTKRYRIVGIACRDAPRRWLVLDVRPLRSVSN